MWIPEQRDSKLKENQTSKQTNITNTQRKKNKQQQTAGKTPGAVDRAEPWRRKPETWRHSL